METKIKERPILFSGEMVRAILEGRKTVTRRVIKPQPNLFPNRIGKFDGFHFDDNTQSWMEFYSINDDKKVLSSFRPDIKCPYGVKGDRLWVREAWAVHRDLYDWDYVYAADIEDHGGLGPRGRWNLPVDMPRRASRITLEITEVRVEQLQDISEGQAQKEGWNMSNLSLCHAYDPASMSKAREWFQGLWNSIYGDRDGCNWDSNPWVWVIEFKQISQESK